MGENGTNNSLPVKRAHHVMVGVRDGIIVFGGSASTGYGYDIVVCLFFYKATSFYFYVSRQESSKTYARGEIKTKVCVKIKNIYLKLHLNQRFWEFLQLPKQKCRVMYNYKSNVHYEQ